jgi:hypothetical protein
MENVETFGSPLLSDVAFEQDGTLKQTGKQNIKFYNRKRLSFRAKPLLDENGVQLLDEKGKPRFVMDSKTGLPAKEAFEEMVEMVRVETKGDTNIIDDVADEFRKRQFYRQYKFFREGKIPDGNPIEDFDFLQSATIMELHMLGIHVIQQVALMSDLECERLKDQSGFEIRDIAAQWVKINSPQGQAGKASRLELEVEKLKRELADVKSVKGRLARQEAAEQILEQGEPEEPMATMELTPEQMAKGSRGIKRKV